MHSEEVKEGLSFMKFSNKQFDAIKWIALVLVPASATLVLTVGKIWELPYYDNIAATITAFGLFLAAIIGVSTNQFNAMANEEVNEEGEDGTLNENDA